MSRQMKKYKPVKLPRKRPNSGQAWFDIVDACNRYSVGERDKWQEKGERTVSGWCVQAPNGFLLPSTFGVGRQSAMKKCFEQAFKRFNGMIPHLFSEWKKVGYKVVKVKWEVEK